MSAKDFADKPDRHIRQVQLWQLSRRGIIIDRRPNKIEMENPIGVTWKTISPVHNN
jgi:hypothetical protein